jgi:hypothetical protein
MASVLREPCLFWCPAVHGSAKRALRKCHSIAQRVDLGEFDLDVSGDQFSRVWTFEHELCHSNPQYLRVDGTILLSSIINFYK